LARALDVPHRTMRWTGEKPKSGVPAAARTARYRLLAGAARQSGASHIFTAHTRDDQAETLLMRLVRGSGISGLAAMARESEREGVFIARPFLNISKSRLIATLTKANIGYADDPTNRDVSFTRPRIRSVIEGLATEGGDARNLARLASRLARANAAIEVLVDGAARYLALRDREAQSPVASGAQSPSTPSTAFEAAAFARMPEEIRLRLLLRAIDRAGREGPAELGKVEALLAVFDKALRMANERRQVRLKQTLAGAVISLNGGRIVIGPAPPRRDRGS
jgi:tRNA(Ile)-lysidine synthase